MDVLEKFHQVSEKLIADLDIQIVNHKKTLEVTGKSLDHLAAKKKGITDVQRHMEIEIEKEREE